MSPTLTFDPLPDSDFPFNTAQIELHKESQVYVIGFRRNPITTFGLVGDLGFSGELVDDKLCIIPADSAEARKMKDAYAALWLAPGYKVILTPAEGSEIYYQRAIPGNSQWKKVKHGHGVDIADPLMTVLDDAIHIKFDTRAETHKGDELFRKLLKFLRRDRDHNRTAAGTGYRPLVRHVHTEIEGTETHDGVRQHQIAARVTVKWGGREAEGWRRLPSRGHLALESVVGRPLLSQAATLDSESATGGAGQEMYVDVDADVKSHEHWQSGAEASCPPFEVHPDKDDSEPVRPVPERSETRMSRDSKSSRSRSRSRTNSSAAK